MKKVLSMLAILVMFGVLCTGCKKADPPAPAVEQATTAPAKNWTPPTAAEPKAHDPNDGQDHSGHGH